MVLFVIVAVVLCSSSTIALELTQLACVTSLTFKDTPLWIVNFWIFVLDLAENAEDGNINSRSEFLSIFILGFRFRVFLFLAFI